MFLFGPGCASEPIDGPSGPADEAVLGECALDECAAGCTDVEQAFACCVSAHGRGGLYWPATDALASGCAGSTCNEDLYLSEESAVCVAQAKGLSPGTGTCTATFGFLGKRAIWTVMNRTSAADAGYSGQMAQLDAISGEVIGGVLWEVDAR